MARYILENLHGLTFPGWEPERMAKLDELFEAYKPVTKHAPADRLGHQPENIHPLRRDRQGPRGAAGDGPEDADLHSPGDRRVAAVPAGRLRRRAGHAEKISCG